MKSKLTVLVLFTAVILVTTAYYAGNVWAASGPTFTAITLAKGTLGSFEVFNHAVLPTSTATDDDKDKDEAKIWMSLEKTRGSSDLYVQNNTWQALASTGWHSHPGHSLIVVTVGTVTDYESDDPTCTPHVYTVGMAFVDGGGNHVHVIRNESPTDMAQTIAVQLIPAGATRRIPATQPANCPGIN